MRILQKIICNEYPMKRKKKKKKEYTEQNGLTQFSILWKAESNRVAA